jgi:hypothetical protein
MEKRFYGRSSLPVLCVLALLLLGCAVTMPARFYLLDPLAGADSAAGRLEAEGALTIGIGPVSLPEYLDRPQIVTRAGENELLMAEFDRWAEPLKENISIVLEENLQSLLRPEGIAVIPWKGSDRIDYRLSIDILRFDVRAAGKASLVARWSLWRHGEKAGSITKTLSTLSASSKGDGYGAMVTALNQTLDDFSREMARTLKSLHK